MKAGVLSVCDLLRDRSMQTSFALPHVMRHKSVDSCSLQINTFQLISHGTIYFAFFVFHCCRLLSLGLELSSAVFCSSLLLIIWYFLWTLTKYSKLKVLRVYILYFEIVDGSLCSAADLLEFRTSLDLPSVVWDVSWKFAFTWEVLLINENEIR